MNNWTQFLYGLSAAYLIYYLLNLAFDLLTTGKARSSGAKGILTLDLADLDSPIDAALDEDLSSFATGVSQDGLLSSGPLSSTGALKLNEIIGGALKDAVSFSSQIPS
ncbi:hypothetical protein ASE74_04190 [Pedobacter sp. Leaf216]|uniref:hypothetical protein n=1 Tax=Pedobacter sp. Leaf216 TaxID=1735684 RepID=UPI0006F99F0E|nr:hypothetical protein [Pedobacter sp. Leaf216]KQM69220.1 hypothetical protein ASE74_04190 [Pedobacter sp. Leaf216]